MINYVNYAEAETCILNNNLRVVSAFNYHCFFHKMFNFYELRKNTKTSGEITENPCDFFTRYPLNLKNAFFAPFMFISGEFKCLK